jgi:putative hydrolase of the HAD superfamily
LSVSDDPQHRFVKAVAFDFGHTLLDEQSVSQHPRPMPGLLKALPQIRLPMAVWANTRNAGEAAVRGILRTLEIEQYFSSVATSVNAGFRKPAPEFFKFAMSQWSYAKDEILFVCNQLNTDVLGAERYGIRTAWLSGPEFRSHDETMTLDDIQPAFTLSGFAELPSLLAKISRNTGCAPRDRLTS